MPRAYNYEARKQAWQLKLLGFTVREIANELGVALGTAQGYLATPPKPPPGGGCTHSYQGRCGFCIRDQSTPSVPNVESALGQVKVRTGLPLWSAVLLDQPVSPDLYRGEDESRWDDPSQCYCELLVLRRYRISGITQVFVLNPDDPNNNLQPHIRCPKHNSQVRSVYVSKVRTDNDGQLFCNTFLSQRHAESAVAYARKRDVSYVKSKFAVPHRGNVWTMVARKNVTQRTGDRSSLVVEVPAVVVPQFDRLLTKIDPMRGTHGQHGWELPPKPTSDYEPHHDRHDYDQISMYNFDSSYDLIYQVTGKELSDQVGDAMDQHDWDALRKAVRERQR